MVIEGLVLGEVEAGWYTLTCLPLKLLGTEGAPARCILTNPPPEVDGEAEGLADSYDNDSGYDDGYGYGDL